MADVTGAVAWCCRHGAYQNGHSLRRKKPEQAHPLSHQPDPVVWARMARTARPGRTPVRPLPLLLHRLLGPSCSRALKPNVSHCGVAGSQTSDLQGPVNAVQAGLRRWNESPGPLPAQPPAHTARTWLGCAAG